MNVLIIAQMIVILMQTVQILWEAIHASAKMGTLVTEPRVMVSLGL